MHYLITVQLGKEREKKKAAQAIIRSSRLDNESMRA